MYVSCVIHPLIRKKQATPVLAYLILEALSLICGVVVVVLAIFVGTALSTASDTGASDTGIALIVIGAIYAMGVGKFFSNLLISLDVHYF